MDKAQSQLGLTDLYMLLAVVLWSLNFSVIKIALREFSPLGFNGVRLLFASSLLFIFLKLRKEKIGLPRRDWGVFLFLGVIGTTFYQLFFYSWIELDHCLQFSLNYRFGSSDYSSGEHWISA